MPATKPSTRKGRHPPVAQGTAVKQMRRSQRLAKPTADDAAQDIGPAPGDKHALLLTSQEAAGRAAKRVKAVRKASPVIIDKQDMPAHLGGDISAPGMPSVERYPLCTEELISESGDESDRPLALTIPRTRALVQTAGGLPSESPHSFIPDVHNPQALVDDTDSDDGDPEEEEGFAAEQTESEDELMASLENNGHALAQSLAMEAPRWVGSETAAQTRTPQAAARMKASRGTGGEVVTAANRTALSLNARVKLERPEFKTQATAPSAPALNRPIKAQEKKYVPLPLSVPLIHWPGQPNTIIDSSEPSDIDPSPPANAYQVIFPAHGGQLSLKSQHPDIQDVLRASNQRLERDLVSHDAFPDARNRGRSVRLAMVETAKALEPRAKYKQLTHRMINDGTFTRALSAIPNQRISSFRGKVKEKSDAAVASGYVLVSGKSSDKVNWLLPELIYVYPCDFESKSISEAKPYQHSVVVSVIRETFFKGPKSFANRNPDVFRSSLPNRDEKEIPAAMLALVGTAIHASLVDWKSGEFINASSFSADRYLDAYNEHVTLLKAIRTASLQKYHTMTHKLYDVVSGLADPAQTGTPSAVGRLDIDAMEVD
ncbi:hypothetical protein C2E23DRAFT_881394 [Lenzites betulinus]|nr:hypothetical protein C2E23DRAFT_881394 [Lenzites betulinus]